MLKKSHLAFAAISAFALSASASTIVVDHFDTPTATPVVDAWYLSEIVAGGTAGIQDLTGAGGNLEAGQPLPNGAAQLTTTSSNSDKSIVATYADFGLASSALAGIQLSYSYYKTGNLDVAAPAIKLEIYAAGGTGDNYGALIYEPYWNGSVTSDAWTNVSINSATGAGGDGTGGWWWNGGFEIPNAAGGPPLRSLTEWIAAFQAADAADFANAHIVGLEMGVGSYNPNQNDYFDNVSIKVGNIDKTFDFQSQSVPDGGSVVALMGGALAGLAALRRKFGV